MRPIVFIDSEIDPVSEQILDIGDADSAVRKFHSAGINSFAEFVEGYEYIVGHNIIAFDHKYLSAAFDKGDGVHYIDTLCLPRFFFPQSPIIILLRTTSSSPTNSITLLTTL